MIFGFAARICSTISIGRWLMSNSSKAARSRKPPRLASKYRSPKAAWIYFAFSVASTISAILARNLIDNGAGEQGKTARSKLHQRAPFHFVRSASCGSGFDLLAGWHPDGVGVLDGLWSQLSAAQPGIVSLHGVI